MLERIIEFDQELFLYLNSKHIYWLDPVMLFLSSYSAWVLMCIAMIAFIYLRSKSWKITTSLAFLLTVGMSALLTNLVKVMVGRPRPIHNIAWKDSIHAIEKYSESTSFFSSHSATTFAMAVFFFLFVKYNSCNKLLGYLAILWAAVVAYSRIYLAKHYPVDVFCGILFGTLVGIVGYKILGIYTKKKEELKA
jgi:undecaprenyl-diphosphatase